MNLDQLNTQAASDAGVEVQLKHPVTGALLQAWITVHGRDSQIYHDKQADIGRRRMNAIASGRAQDGDALERTTQEATELLASLTAGWRGIEFEAGPVACSERTAIELYTKRGLRWIREQVDEAIHNRALFLPGGASN